MNKKVGSFIAVYAIIFIIFNVVALVIPFESYASRWITFVFMDIAILLSAGITWIAFSKGEDVKSKFYGFPVFRIGIIYSTLQFVVWLIISCICFAVEVPGWISVIICTLFLGFAFVGVTAIDNVRDIAEEQDNNLLTKTKVVKDFSIDIDSLILACEDEKLKKALKKLAEEVKYSDPVSSEATAEIEAKIQKEVDLLAGLARLDYGEAMEMIENISNKLARRNSLCKEKK